MFVIGVAAVLLSQIVLAAAFTGVGLRMRRAFGLTKLGLNECFDAFWIGLSVVILAVMLWNFVFPINGVMLVLVLAAGAAGIVLWRGSLGGILEGESWRSNRWSWAAIVVAALWVANQGLGEMTYYDSALYHMQAVQWAERYPVVPGLVNLSAPLAYNNASLLYSAMLDQGPWAGIGFRLANGLLVQVFLLRMVVAVARLTTDPLKAGAREMFAALLIPAAISFSFFSRLSSYATAAPNAILLLVVAERLYALLAAPRGDPREAGYDVVSITTLSAACVAIKLSAVVFCALALALALLVWLRRAESRGDVPRVATWALGSALLIGGAWTARGVVLSGYPAFPSRVVSVPVDWRAPAEHADAEYALVEHSSKASTMLNDVVSGRDRWGWLPRWTRVQLREPFYVFIPLALGLLAALWLALEKARAGPGAAVVRDQTLWMLVPIFGALLAWFWLAPEGRYAAGFAWALPALLGAHAWKLRIARGATVRSRFIPISAAVLGAITLIDVPLTVAQHESPGAVVKTIIKQNVKLWEPGTWTERLPVPPLDTFTTQSGLVLSVPKDRCFDAPPPCTPNPAPNLELRSPPDLRSGFRVTGAWAMRDWPSTGRPKFLESWRQSRAK